MGERTTNEGQTIRERMLKFYDVAESERGGFFLQIDWILENAVYPKENGYADNLIELWDLYMPEYPFDQIILEYSKKYFPVLRYVHENELYKFNSFKHMQEGAIKNYVKYAISQGVTDRMTLVKECFDVFKEITDRAKLYDFINNIIERYSINQRSVMFLKRFQDYYEQPYREIVDRMTDIQSQKNEALNARTVLFNSMKSSIPEEKYQGLINVLLCRIAASDGERRFSDVLEEAWNNTMNGIAYHESVYTFIDKYEKAYMNAACFGIENIRDMKVIRQLYKDAVILCAFLQIAETNMKFGIRDVNDFWKKEGMIFANGYFFDEEYERMKAGLNKEILLENRLDIERFHDLLLQRIEVAERIGSTSRPESKRRHDVSSEMNKVALKVKERRIEDLQERISELEEKTENAERDVLSQFLSLLDSKKYGHVLGKLYRTAYSDDAIDSDDIQIILKNLFEIMNISGIDIYGELGAQVNNADIRRGKYRVNGKINGNATIMYPGYKVGNTVILHPIVEEVK